MNKLLIILIVAVGCSFGCASKKKVAKKNDSATNIVQEKTMIEQAGTCTDAVNKIGWREVKDDANADKVASKAKMYRIDNSSLERVLTGKFSENSSFVMTLPFFHNGQTICKRFEVENSGTMQRAQQKEMGVFSFKGIDLANSANTVRIDYYLASGLKAYGFVDGESLILQPIENAGGIYYLSYNKNDANALKSQFEITE